MAKLTKLDRFKMLLGNSLDGESDPQGDFILEFSLERVENAVKNYCNITEIPVGLETLILQMAVELYRAENLGEEEAGVTVKSITKGDTSTTFTDSSSTNKTYTDGLLRNYYSELQAYRKVRW